MIHTRPCAQIIALSAFFALSALSGSAFARPGGPGGFPGQPPGGGSRADILEKLDENADGIVTLDEFDVTRTERAGRRFDNLDQDDDGAISEEEYDAGFSGGFAGRHGGFALDREALQACMEDQLGTAFDGRPTWEDLVAEADDDGNEVIDEAEFLAHQTAKAVVRFDEIDTNADGGLDETELDAVSTEMQNMRTAHMTCMMEQREMNGVLDF